MPYGYELAYSDTDTDAGAPSDEGTLHSGKIILFPDDEENILNFESIRVYNLERKVIAEYAAPYQVTGYEYEVQSAMRSIRANGTRTEIRWRIRTTHTFSIRSARPYRPGRIRSF